MSRSSSDSDGDDERCRSIEMVRSEELEDALNYSDEESTEKREKKPQRKRKEPARVFQQEVDTNVFNISMATLKQGSELATGDPVFCGGCQAAFSVLSKIDPRPDMIGEEAKEGGRQVWVCEFCYSKNEVQMEPEEIPKTDQVTYMLEAAAQVFEKKQTLTQQDISVVFCIDVSGSMCVSQPIAGKYAIKGDKTGALRDLLKFSDGSDQRLEGESNVTYVSRLQCVQAAIDS